MPHPIDKTRTTYTTLSRNLEGLVWNADLTLQDVSQAAMQRRQAINEARANRPRTAQIEREIMIAVVVLYALILGSFAALHVYGGYAMAEKDKPSALAEPAEQRGPVVLATPVEKP